jgi:hypothetical protein
LHIDHKQGCSLGVQLLKPVELAAPGKHPINDMTADTDLMQIDDLQAGRLCVASDSGRVGTMPAGGLFSPGAIAMM